MSIEKVSLRVEGMSCNHCKMAVEKALRGLPGVSECSVDLGNKNVMVTFDSGVATLSKIKDAISNAGYEVVAN